jgi:hypothetical protein
MFQALRTMLLSPNTDTQRAALHGLFHIEHRDGPGCIRAWLNATPGLAETTRRYAEAVLAGQAI